MEYRKLPHGEEKLSVLGLGLGSIGESEPEEITKVIRKAISNGINFFDLCAGHKKVYKAFGEAINQIRDKVILEVHFGAIYNQDGEYGWSRNLNTIKDTFQYELEALGTDYVDFGFLHCVDALDDYEDIKKSGILDYVLSLKEKGIVRHLGFSSHTPSVAQKLIDDLPIDVMLFSINPAYDLEQGDELGIGTSEERRALFTRCEKEGIGITVMKPFHGGQLLDKERSPFHIALSKNQCIQYCLDRPSVLSVVPGVRNLNDLDSLLDFINSSKEENDYSIISSFTPESALGHCVYCNHCLPCPKGIDIGLVNKYYDLALAGDKMAYNHYSKLKINADDCSRCGHCEKRCPFKTKQMSRMQEISSYFRKGETK